MGAMLIAFTLLTPGERVQCDGRIWDTLMSR